MDLIRAARDEIACEEESRRSENFKSFEANDRRDSGKSAPTWYLAVYASLMLMLPPGRGTNLSSSHRGPASMDLIRVISLSPARFTDHLQGA
jgi:hypothetical protein